MGLKGDCEPARRPSGPAVSAWTVRESGRRTSLRRHHHDLGVVRRARGGRVERDLPPVWRPARPPLVPRQGRERHRVTSREGHLVQVHIPAAIAVKGEPPAVGGPIELLDYLASTRYRPTALDR